jgi:glutamine synthetase
VQCGDLSSVQAETAAKSILFENSNRLYQLNASLNDKPSSSYSLPMSVTRTKQAGNPSHDQLDTILQKFPDLEYVWMQWIDYTATLRVRIFPIAEFVRIARKQRRVGISLAVFWMLQDDTVLPEGSTTGQFYLEPDLSSLYQNASMKTSASSATIMNFWRSEGNEPIDGCPRSTLENIVQKLRTEHDVEALCGFEIEVIFLKPRRDAEGRITDYIAATENHSWSQMTSETRKTIPLLEQIHQTLASMGINLQQFHAESAPGQFEFILPPAKPLAAVDILYAARQVITAIADEHGLRATLHPRPFSSGAGSAAHAHISINKVERESSFLSGVLTHFPAIAAFTLSQDASYERVRSGIWAGSEWVAWGFQNREAPVRKIGAGHWEFKSVDGVANTYFAMAALLAGGYIGLSSGAELKVKECTGMFTKG